MSSLAWFGIGAAALIVGLAVVAGRRKSGVNKERPNTAEELTPANLIRGSEGI